MTDKLKELVAKWPHEYYDRKGRRHDALIPETSWVHADELCRRCLVEATLAASEPSAGQTTTPINSGAACASFEFQMPASDLQAKLEALRDEMAEHAGIKRPGSKVGIWAKRLTAILEGKV